MGKDREGRYHPPKGKPSGTGNPKGEIIPPTDEEKLDEQFEIEKKYSIDPDHNNADGVKVRHPNRNVDKVTDRKTEAQKKTSNKRRSRNQTEELTDIRPSKITEGFSKVLIEQLSSYSGPCVSIYLQTHQTGVEVNEQVDIITFKNLLQTAADELTNAGAGDVQKILEPAYELLRDDQFWTTLPPGMAFFITPDFFGLLELPQPVESLVHTDSTFLVGPLVPFISAREYFYLLVISKKQSKLFRGDNFQLTYINVEGLPYGIGDVVRFEEKDDEKLFRTESSGAGSGANYHGMGAGKPDEKQNISMYLAEVDSTLRTEILKDENVPLVLAGVDYLVALFKKITHYDHVWDASLTGSLENENDQVLFQRSRELLHSYFNDKTRKALDEYGDRSATHLTTSNPQEVIKTAYSSRVGHLFISRNERLWGTFIESEMKITISNERQNGDEDLLNKVVIKTILNGGEVHVLDKEDMPASATIAALLRY